MTSIRRQKHTDDSPATILAENRGRIAAKIGGLSRLDTITTGDIRLGKIILALLGIKKAPKQVVRLGDILSSRVILGPTVAAHQLRRALAALCEAIDGAQTQTLGDEIAGLCGTRIIHRFGLDGNEPMTLNEVGDKAGVVRERIRQNEGKFRRQLAESPQYTPALDRALHYLDDAVRKGVVESDALTWQMRQAGIFRGDDTIAGLLACAKLFGRSQTYCLILKNSTYIVARFDDMIDDQQAAVEAAKIIADEATEYGVCLIRTLRERLNDAGYAKCADRLADVMVRIPDFLWVSPEVSCRLRTNRNGRPRFITPTRKILAIAPHILISDLRLGLNRSERVTDVPDNHSLCQILCDELGDEYGLVIDGDWIRAAKPPQPKEVLSPNDWTVYDILLANGGVMERYRLEAAAAARKMNPHTINQMLSSWPWIRQYDRCVYGLRGVDVPPGTVESFSRASDRRRTVRAFGHQPDGRLWLSRSLRAYDLKHSMVSIPLSLKSYIPDGYYSLSNPQQLTRTYRASVSNAQIRFNGKFLEHSDAKESAIVRIVINTEDKSMGVLFGGSELLEPPHL